MNASGAPPLLAIRDLRVRFDTPRGAVHAVRGVDIEIREGEVLALVGESGSGKSMTGMAIMGLLPGSPGRVTSGEIRFHRRDGGAIDLLAATPASLRSIRGNEIAMIFQEPMTSLNPVLRIGQQVAEAARRHHGLSARAARALAVELLDLVGIPEPAERLDDYPHQLSGGMRQRVMIAAALACRPRLLIADEPTTALDVTIQAQILELIARLRRDLGMAVLFVTHDLGVVAHIADRVAVMYAGQIVERAPVTLALERPRHPYMRGLLDSAPSLDDDAAADLVPIPGMPPDPRRLPPGCAFQPRCRFSASGHCDHHPPALEGTALEAVRCHYPDAALAGAPR